MKTARLAASLWTLAGCATTSGSKDPVNCYRPCSESAEGVEAYRECVDACLEGKPRRPQIKARFKAGAKGNVKAGAEAAPPAAPLPKASAASEAPEVPLSPDVEFLGANVESETRIRWADFRVKRDRLYRLFTHPKGQCPPGIPDDCFRHDGISRMHRMAEDFGTFNPLQDMQDLANGHKPSGLGKGKWVIPEEADVPDLQAVCTHPAVRDARVCKSIWIGEETFTKPGEVIGALSQVAFLKDKKEPIGERVIDSIAGVGFKWKPGRGRR